MRPRRLINRGRNDSGAMGVLFAVLFGTGAMLGLLALSIDVGAVYLERRTVQVGADAAAEGLGYRCALNAAECQSVGAATTFARMLLDANSGDGATAVEEVCGSTLGPCAPLSGREPDCQVAPVSGAYVRVTSQTDNAGTNRILTPFTDVLDGSASDGDGVTLWGCAQSRWGKVDTAELSLDVVLPPCEFSVGGSSKVVVAVGNIQAGTCSSVTAFGDDGNLAAITINQQDPISTAALIDLGTGDCTASTSVTVPTTYSILPNIAGACSGSLFARLAGHIDSGRTVLVPMGWRLSANSVTVRTFAGVRFTAYCTRGGRDNCLDGYGAIGEPGWPNSCSAARPCLSYSYANEVLAYREIAETASSVQPNFGVQTVKILP